MNILFLGVILFCLSSSGVVAQPKDRVVERNVGGELLDSTPRRVSFDSLEIVRDGKPHMIARVSVYGGVAFPLSEFSESSGGAAQIGFLLALDLNVIPSNSKFGWLTSLNVVRNGFDASAVGLPAGFGVTDEEAWVCIWPVTGVTGGPFLEPDINLTLSGQIGVLFANSPGFTIVSNGVSGRRIAGATDKSIAFSFSAKIETEKRFSFGFRYLQGSPRNMVRISIINFTTGYTF